MVFLGNISKIFSLLMVLIAVSQANDVSWYRNFLSEKVAPPYLAAYRILKDQIINPLLAFNNEELPDNETNVTVADVVSLAQNLTCATKELYTSLSFALNASEQLNQDLDRKLLQLVSSISQKENEVLQVNNQLRTIQAQLADTQGKVNDAENTVRNKENELNQADSQLAEEQRKVDAARLCGLRKKRFLGNIIKPIVRPFKPILKPILRPICAVINYGGINGAKDRRGAAQGAVNAAREQLANRREELERFRIQYTNFQNQQSQTSGQLKSLTDSLAQLQARQVALANMTQDMRNIMKHLATFVSKSSVLYDELQDLVSFELLIEPLNSILTELIDNGVTNRIIAGATQISSTDIDLIKNVIDILQTELPNLPLNEGASNIC